MANISQDALLSAASMLMRRAREAGSAMDRSESSGAVANQAAEITLGGPAYTRDAVQRLITEYLNTPTHISSTFPSW